jgi:predicted nuclease with TOPRIM domain
MNGKISIAVILAVAIQAIGLVWYVSKIDSKVETMYSEFQANNKTEVIENQVRMKLDLENVINDLKSLKGDVKKMQNKDQTIIKQNNKIERQHEKLFDLIDSNKNKKQQKGQEQQYSYD